MKPILEIQGISKKFQIQSNQQPYLSLRENLFSFFKPTSKKEEFWALKDVTFDVMPGDTIGIIGKNGAGKSTLLKVLSKITPPTSGKIISRGRIASLLEVGTGFHPELSGRENIFMNGSILGMRRMEIVKNFDAIVDFAGVEKFIDTPLKHYSSGMQLRLAFAVAAFLENEILIIDEVLAVGDAEFQKKCMGKMGEVSKSGRTVLFVSHNIPALKNVCKKGIVLQMGNLEKGVCSIAEAVDVYNKNWNKEFLLPSENIQYYSNEYIDIKKVSFQNSERKKSLLNTEVLEFNVEFELFKSTPQFELGYRLLTSEGELLYWSYFHDEDEKEWPKINVGKNKLQTVIPTNMLNSGIYRVELVTGLRNMFGFFNYGDYNSTLEFEIQEPLSSSSMLIARRDGVMGPILKWHNTLNN